MAWGSVDVEEQRMRFVVAVSRREKPLQQLCLEFGISRPTDGSGYGLNLNFKAAIFWRTATGRQIVI
jgi:hypothetical protein